MTDDYCPKCGEKCFVESSCSNKWRCWKCNYFLADAEFQELKRRKKN